jgi:hypothetical protein
MKFNCFSLSIRGFALIVIILSIEAFGYFPDSSFLPYADSLFRLDTDTQLTARRIKKEKHTYFMVTTCKTIAAPMASVANTVRHIGSYPDYFTFITKADRIANKTTPTDSVTMFVGGYGLYRVYFFGKIRDEYTADSSRYRIFCGDVEQKQYRKAWKKKVRGLIKIGSHDVDIFWTAEKRSDSTTRVSLTASQAFTTPIANWMISIGTNRIFRGMLKDLEKYLLKMEHGTPVETVLEPHQATTPTVRNLPGEKTAPAEQATPDSPTVQGTQVIPVEQTMPADQVIPDKKNLK